MLSSYVFLVAFSAAIPTGESKLPPPPVGAPAPVAPRVPMPAPVPAEPPPGARYWPSPHRRFTRRKK